MSKLTIALCASAFAFGSAAAQADDGDKNPPEEKAAAKSQPAPKKDWPTRREKQEAAAAAARERAERVAPKEQPLEGDFGPPGPRAADRSRVKPKATPITDAEKAEASEKAKTARATKGAPKELTTTKDTHP